MIINPEKGDLHVYTQKMYTIRWRLILSDRKIVDFIFNGINVGKYKLNIESLTMGDYVFKMESK